MSVKEQVSVNMECSICMDDIMINSNCITTECGHTFHASCLMKNVAHNGFGCPNCRTVMAEDPTSDDEDDESEASLESFEQEELDDQILRGFRLFFNYVEQTEPYKQDVAEETGEPLPKPSSTEVTQKLTEQGVTMEDLVKCLLVNHNEYSDEEEEFMRVDDNIWNKFRTIIDNFAESEH